MQNMACISIADFASMLNITPDDLLNLERGKVIPSRDLMVEFCRTLKVSESELVKADDFSRSSEEVELLELVERRNMVIKGTLSIRDNYDVIETPIYDPETGEESFEIITHYNQAKEAILHEFQKMTLDELIDLYRHFADGKISFFLNNMSNSLFLFL